MRIRLAYAQHLILSLFHGKPLAKALTVWISGLCKVRKIGSHLSAYLIVFPGERSPTMVECAKPVPEVAAVPCAGRSHRPIISGNKEDEYYDRIVIWVNTDLIDSIRRFRGLSGLFI